MKITRQDIFVAIITGAVLLGIPTTRGRPSVAPAVVSQNYRDPIKPRSHGGGPDERSAPQTGTDAGVHRHPPRYRCARSQRRRWLHDGVAGPINRTYRQSLWPEPAARPQPSANRLLRARGQQPPKSRAGRDPAAPPAGARPSPVALADREARLHEAGIPAAPIVALSRPFEDPVPSNLASEQIDLATLMFNYHDFGHLGVDRAAMNRAVFSALKPGGLFVIADHAGRAGTGISESGTLHRVEEAFLRQEVEAAGFRLVEEGKFLRNPNDPRDKNTPDPPQPEG